MERIGGFKAEPLAARREAALIALTLIQKQLDGDCRELLREYAPILVIVKVPEVKEGPSARSSGFPSIEQEDGLLISGHHREALNGKIKSWQLNNSTCTVRFCGSGEQTSMNAEQTFSLKNCS